MTLKFDGPWKFIGQLFYITSSFVHHLKPLGEFKQELLSGNAQLGSKLAIFLSHVTLKFDGWPWKNDRAPLLCHIKRCASFQSHQWIQTGVTVRKCSIRVKIGNFLSRVTSKFDGWPWKTIEHLFYDASSFVHHFIAIGEFKTKITIRKRSIRVKIGNFLSRVTLIFDGWP